MHKPIYLKDISLYFPSICCFKEFSTQVNFGDRIAIIGKNGNGKSSLLNILCGKLINFDGELAMPDDVCIGHTEQTIGHYHNLSGGQRFNKALSEALSLSPNLLLLDEPTNHLDVANRKSLIRMLQNYQGTIITVSHDIELLRRCANKFWHIDNNKIHEFSGYYDDYIDEVKQRQLSIEQELSLLKHAKKDVHKNLMKEQKRAAVSKDRGKKSIQQRKWPTVVSKTKALRANNTSGKKQLSINKKKQSLTQQLSDLRMPEAIVPKFSLCSDDVSNSTILSINNSDIGYVVNKPILRNINLQVSGKDRVAICGKNTSGKSTLLQAIIGKSNILKTGQWHVPNVEDIGYLDQHYLNLNPDISVIEHIYQTRPDWREREVRKHLNDFLFRKNEEVNNLVSNLSGGEKARLSLSLISAKTPKLLILDEITNNFDIETKEHVIQVLKVYPGAMIIVSHEEEFLQAININYTYQIEGGKF
ncbi:ATP-binding cassette domain-containing protein [Thiotrichales bacterium 19S9-12]|nr:ATP-binding cassette domain-containing protein [Thiotrichales bacterium 19S9-11]MCF6812244.1 ATP-binding cassette domain-containing protein [Thiotrichales bacterium 19S9-12]